MNKKVYIQTVSGLILILLSGLGEGWQISSPPVSADLYAVSFANGERGWCVGEKGVILSTSDGGKTWVKQDSPVNLDLYDVCFISPEEGWAVGKKGTVIHTKDGGTTWVKVEVPTDRSLYAVYFANDKVGWVAGWLGTILHTTDGGRSWISQGGAEVTITDLFFIDEKTGWAVGINGLILHTADGGRRWFKQRSYVRNFLYGIFFINPDEGWVVGDGVILHTLDGGKEWKVQTKGKWVLKSVYFPIPTLGWAVGNNGVILKTTNGGRNWRIEPTPVSDNLLSISQGGPKLWVVGGKAILSQGNVPPPSRLAQSWEELDEFQKMPYEPVIKRGSLTVISTPAGANITLNGKPTGQKTPASISDLPPGRYTLKLTKLGYGHKVKTVFLREGEEKTIRFDLVSRSRQISVLAAGVGLTGIAIAIVYLFSGTF